PVRSGISSTAMRAAPASRPRRSSPRSRVTVSWSTPTGASPTTVSPVTRATRRRSISPRSIGGGHVPCTGAPSPASGAKASCSSWKRTTSPIQARQAMDTLIVALRWVHIAAGTVALVLAPLAMLTVKGGGAHRRWGKIYFWAMAVVAVTAVVLALWRPQIFLALLAGFSFYMALRGYRALSRNRPLAGQGAAAVDWTAALVTLVASAALVVLGLVRPGSGWQRLGIVPVVFGALGMILAGLDVAKFVRPPVNHHAWWFAHMGGMLGSYIATVSAFSVVNFAFLPTTVRWLWPTLIGTPLIAVWIAYYRIRLRRPPVAGIDAAPANCATRHPGRCENADQRPEGSMANVEFGLFDWIDRRQQGALGQLYEDRPRLLQEADTAGFYCYHLAEHHATPLGMAPSPSVFLAA